MARKCSICNSEGHNSRTCNVQDPAEFSSHENASKDNHFDTRLNLTLGCGLSEGALSSQTREPRLAIDDAPSIHGDDHHEQDEINKGGGDNETKGERWSREEHLGFVRGLKVMGKGQWKAMSSDFVPTRTPDQISSHAQKYFKRVKDPLKRKRNPSIFDVGRDDQSDPCCLSCKHLLREGRHRLFQPHCLLHDQPYCPPSPGIETRQTLVTLDLLSNFIGLGDEECNQDNTDKDEVKSSDTREKADDSS